MRELKYLAGYSEKITGQVSLLISENRLGSFLLKKYPSAHDIRTEKALYDFAVEIKNGCRKMKSITLKSTGTVAYS